MKRARKAARALQASLVVTVALAPACKPGATGGTSGDPSSDDGVYHVSRRPDGTCTLYQSMSCPKNATCNPPPPMEVDCPEPAPGEATVDAGIASKTKPPPTPPGKQGWVHVRPHVWVSAPNCHYQPGRWCPGDRMRGECTHDPAVQVRCTFTDGDGGLPLGADAGYAAFQGARVTLEPTVFKAQDGRCFKSPELSCQPPHACVDVPLAAETPCEPGAVVAE